MYFIFFWHTASCLFPALLQEANDLQLLGNLELIQSSSIISNVLVSLSMKDILMISPWLFFQLKVHASKKKLTKAWTSFPFFYFLICLQVWIRSGQGKVLIHRCALRPPPPHMGLKSARLQIHIDLFALFCKLKFFHSFDAHRNAVLCSPPSSWKHSLGRPAFPCFFFIFSGQILVKRPKKSIKSMNGFSSKTHAFKGEMEREREREIGE